jgi:Vitamin B12 dependent methionine synthase, activation domain
MMYKLLYCNLQEIVATKSLQLKAVVGIWPASAKGDDIQVSHCPLRRAPLCFEKVLQGHGHHLHKHVRYRLSIVIFSYASWRGHEHGTSAAHQAGVTLLLRPPQLFEDDSRGEVLATFHGLRQQAEKDNKEPYVSLSDFIAPQVRMPPAPSALAFCCLPSSRGTLQPISKGPASSACSSLRACALARFGEGK